LRIVLIEDEPGGAEGVGRPEGLLLLQADVDDMSPEFVPPALEALLAAGAVDVWAHPTTMKKGRPGLRIEALVPAFRRREASDALFRHTTTLGLRYWPVERETLHRDIGEVTWRGFRIRVKRAILPDGTSRLKPEYEDIIQVASALGVAPLQLMEDFRRELDGT
jgi:hypothetical protein